MAAETTYIADYLEQHKDEILNRWRQAAESEVAQAERLAKMDDRELLDHLPALTEALIGVLRGEEGSQVEIDARRHGHQRRLDGYSVVDVLWELTTFRRVFLGVLDEASVAVTDWIPVDGSTTILDLLDLCARASIDQHVKETEQERDAAATKAGILETQRQRFLGTLSHELRNQIQPILFALQRLKADEPSDTSIARARDDRTTDPPAVVSYRRSARPQSKRNRQDRTSPVVGRSERMRAARRGDEPGRG